MPLIYLTLSLRCIVLLTSVIADKYATKQVIKSLTLNANNEKIKLVMEAGQFSNINEATSKFLGASNNTQNNSASVLFMGYRGQPISWWIP